MRVYIVDIVDPRTEKSDQKLHMLELEQLVTTYGGLVIVKTIQKRQHPDYKTYVGSGKLDEILQDMISSESDLLIIGNILKPAQIFAVNEYIRTHPLMKDYSISLQARDKIDLILKIFDKHAQSTEAKLQIQLAAIRHMGPRIFGMGIELSKQGGSSGGGGGAMRGLGETNTERMRRHLKDEAFLIEQKLKKFENMRSMQRSRRKRVGLPSFGIVGYTNAGKSSLMNILTRKGVYADDKLFATLGTRVGKIYLPTPEAQFSDKDKLSSSPGENSRGKEALLIDTIGFIRDLPPQLIKAFASTLEDSIQSDVLLHVIDAADADIERKIETVEDILIDIGAQQDMIIVLNKSDLLTKQQKEYIADLLYGQEFIFVSTVSEEGIEELKEAMRDKMKKLDHS